MSLSGDTGMSEESGAYGNTLTVSEALNLIESTDCVLPSIQRPFVWKYNQIEEFFDSLMRGYPIGTFMFWNLKKESFNKGLIKLYRFINNADEASLTDNEEFNPKFREKDIITVIDGQQRLTALNIGLKGYYKFHKKGARISGDYPKRKLYLDISGTISDEKNDSKKYNFKFLTKDESYGKGHIWFNIQDMENWDDNSLKQFVESKDYPIESYEILLRLKEMVFDQKSISYYLLKEQDPDEVLDIFIRANSGGSPLSKSDLLMSMATHLWKTDIRDEMTELIMDVSKWGVGDCKFVIDKDFVLKTCLVLHSNDVRTILANFHPNNIKKFEENWEKTKKCIKAAFQYLHKLGFNNKTIQAKAAVIAIICYIYYNDIQDQITKDTFDPSGINRKYITTWLVRAFINGIYSGAQDSTHLKMKNLILNNLNNKDKLFPYGAILNAYKDEGKSLYVSDDVLKKRIRFTYRSGKAGYILILLHQGESFTSVHEDHLHPQVLFEKKGYREVIKNKEIWKIIDDTWDTVLNLQLLDGGVNESKGDMPLTEWMSKYNVSPESIYLDKDTSTNLEDYDKFISVREKNILAKLKSIMDLE